MAEIRDCSENAARAFYFLVGRGLTSAQAAGVIGNLQFESGINPQILPIIDTDRLPHQGIAQWSPSRWQDLLTFCYAKGFDPQSLEGQLEFLWHELEDQPGLGLRELASTTTVEDATVTFQNRFERCGTKILVGDPVVCHTSERIKLAYDALSCLSVAPPTRKGRVNVVAASLGMLALVAAAGYGAYRALRGV